MAATPGTRTSDSARAIPSAAGTLLAACGNGLPVSEMRLGVAGEMSQSEVTRENYPGLFALRDALKRRGIVSYPRAFDQYQGPYLSVPGVGKVWYTDGYYQGVGPVYAWHGDLDATGRKLRRVDRFVIDNGIAPAFGGTFQTEGASYVMPEDTKSVTVGVYTLRQAARRIAEVAK